MRTVCVRKVAELAMWKSVKYVVFGFAALSCIAGSAADIKEMPRFDVDGFCKQEASLYGTVNQSVLRSCYDREQSDYNELKPAWGKLRLDIRDACLTIAYSKNATGGFGSYETLGDCLEMKLKDAAEKEKNSKNKFKY